MERRVCRFSHYIASIDASAAIPLDERADLYCFFAGGSLLSGALFSPFQKKRYGDGDPVVLFLGLDADSRNGGLRYRRGGHFVGRVVFSIQTRSLFSEESSHRFAAFLFVAESL